LTIYSFLQEQGVESKIQGGSKTVQGKTALPDSARLAFKGDSVKKFSLSNDTASWESESPSIVDPNQEDTIDPPGLTAIEVLDVRVETAVNKSVTIKLQGDAPQAIRALSFSIVEEPLNGELSTPLQVATQQNLPNRISTVRYRPLKGYVGTDGFAFEACDRDQPSNCSVGTATIFVDYPAPVARNLSIKTDHNQPIKIDFANLARQATILQLPDNGTLTDRGGGKVRAGQSISGSLLYTPDFGFSEVDVIRYELTKDGVKHSAEVDITVSAQDNCLASGREENCASDLSFR